MTLVTYGLKKATVCLSELLVPIYSAVHSYWPLKELAEMADWPAAYSKVARVGVYLLGTSL